MLQKLEHRIHLFSVGDVHSVGMWRVTAFLLREECGIKIVGIIVTLSVY